MDYREYNDNKVFPDSEKSSFSKVIGNEFILDYTLIENQMFKQILLSQTLQQITSMQRLE